MTTDEIIEVLQAFKNGRQIEAKLTICNGDKDTGWYDTCNPSWDFENYMYRVKEHVYPMWFQGQDKEIVRFDSLNHGEVISKGAGVIEEGHYSYKWIPHTDKAIWTQVDEPKKTVTYYEVIENAGSYFLSGYLFKEECIPKGYIKTGRSFELEEK